MAEIRCMCTECKHNQDYECDEQYATIESVLTGSGFEPMCIDYDEED